MKIKSSTKHTIIVSEKELDAIQLAIALMLKDVNTHKHWHKVLNPILNKMRNALAEGDAYESV